MNKARTKHGQKQEQRLGERKLRARARGRMRKRERA